MKRRPLFTGSLLGFVGATACATVVVEQFGPFAHDASVSTGGAGGALEAGRDDEMGGASWMPASGGVPGSGGMPTGSGGMSMGSGGRTAGGAPGGTGGSKAGSGGTMGQGGDSASGGTIPPIGSGGRAGQGGKAGSGGKSGNGGKGTGGRSAPCDPLRCPACSLLEGLPCCTRDDKCGCPIPLLPLTCS